ncbi:uncharacterized protein LOC110348928 isoform X2 [Heterocephalus glaber]|uniref:Uncharacterized protein LOC110348928 isoform X2 n=1 Tax=Heterocephalus glaber TaxID=10181 RepID=A0AAX6SVS7_HETGA|nr:uncharacterized protein LOC110348928 isoform X2 [Heterocephalus glaber]
MDLLLRKDAGSEQTPQERGHALIVKSLLGVSEETLCLDFSAMPEWTLLASVLSTLLSPAPPLAPPRSCVFSKEWQAPGVSVSAWAVCQPTTGAARDKSAVSLEYAAASGVGKEAPAWVMFWHQLWVKVQYARAARVSWSLSHFWDTDPDTHSSRHPAPTVPHPREGEEVFSGSWVQSMAGWRQGGNGMVEGPGRGQPLTSWQPESKGRSLARETSRFLGV